MVLLSAGLLIEGDFRQKTEPSLACPETPRVLQVPRHPVTWRTELHLLARRAWERCLLACDIVWKYCEQANAVHKLLK